MEHETIHLRQATPEDAAVILAHRRGMFRDMWAGTAEQLDRMIEATGPWLAGALADGSYHGWLAETADGQVVAGGGVIVTPWLARPREGDPRRAVIVNVYTEPGWRGRGLARRIMAGHPRLAPRAGPALGRPPCQRRRAAPLRDAGLRAHQRDAPAARADAWSVGLAPRCGTIRAMVASVVPGVRDPSDEIRAAAVDARPPTAPHDPSRRHGRRHAAPADGPALGRSAGGRAPLMDRRPSRPAGDPALGPRRTTRARRRPHRLLRRHRPRRERPGAARAGPQPGAPRGRAASRTCGSSWRPPTTVRRRPCWRPGCAPRPGRRSSDGCVVRAPRPWRAHRPPGHPRPAQPVGQRLPARGAVLQLAPRADAALGPRLRRRARGGPPAGLQPLGALLGPGAGPRAAGRGRPSLAALARHGAAPRPGLSRGGDGGDEGTRTPDPRDANAVLSQLSYIPTGRAAV